MHCPISPPRQHNYQMEGSPSDTTKRKTGGAPQLRPHTAPAQQRKNPEIIGEQSACCCVYVRVCVCVCVCVLHFAAAQTHKHPGTAGK